ncbi:SusC/RagA family TonB-linked outer membrane protein [Hymenobacter sp.]|jgi:TonB-linked SusC/RagA family outer membrane protein|uniref:SusC/RagA family TonB-linked outer membrane protein n=1 Tax=Hymenobacter sp. TaxID=1898978 RepID=UPI002EDB8888
MRLRQAPDTIVTTLFIPTITDENYEPLAGVEVFGRRGSLSGVTDALGQVRLAAIQGDTLQLRALGVVVEQYVVRDDLAPFLLLSTKNPAVARLKPVRMLYNDARPDLTAASTQTIYNRDLNRLPVASFLNALSGRVAGMTTNQSSGQPGLDEVTPNLLGMRPLVVIDGIPRDLTIFDLEEIESVTVLKDALSTVMLGARSSNGVLNVTTRKGTPSLPRVSFTVQSAVQQPLKQPKALNAYNYSVLNNEARRNDGLAPGYSDAALQAYQDGSDPFGFPDVDWRKQVLKKSSRLDRYTLSATGGNSFSKYFVSLEHLSQSGLLKESDINPYSTTNTFKSYVVRSNVDLQLNAKLSAGIHLLGRIVDTNEPGLNALLDAANLGPGTATNSIFNALVNTPNNAYPIYNEDGSFGGSQAFQNNLWGQTINSGYQTSYRRDMLADFYLKRTLDEFVPGLYLKAVGSYYTNVSENINRSKVYPVFQRRTPVTNPVTYQQFGVVGQQINAVAGAVQFRTDYVELSAGYDHQFGAHGVNAVLLANRQNSVSGRNLPYTFTGGSGRLAYNFEEKYVAEFAFGLNGSNRYTSDDKPKLGFFPAAGLAWNISREEFMQSATWLSHLKLFGSYGKTGNDNPGDFVYIQRYFETGQPTFGTSGGTQAALSESALANTNITWEKANKLNAGIQGALLNGHLGFTLEYYNNKFYDLLIQRGRNTTLLGNFYPNENIGQNRYSGFTGQLTWQQGSQDFNYYVTGNIGIQKSEVLYADEVFRPYDWMRRTGQQVGQPFGYQADGLFQSADEIAGAATLVGYRPQPGDVRYKDLNSDGVIDQFDQAPMGTTKPLVPFGADFGVRFHSFDLSALVQGVLNRNIYLSGGAEYAFLNNNGVSQVFEQHLDRWTPDNPGASYPRLNIGSNPNNQAFSTYWQHRNNYARLKNVELGYSLPLSISRRVRVQGLRVFTSATNLVTVSEYSRIDPEVFNNGYPQQRLFNLGLNIKL